MSDDALLSDLEMRVYRSMLRSPEIGLAQRAVDLGLSEPVLIDLLHVLRSYELIETVAGRDVVVAPALGLARLAAAEQSRAASRTASLSDVLASLPELTLEHERGRNRSRRIVEFEVVEGAAGALDAVEVLMAATASHFCNMTRLTGSNRPERDVAARPRNAATVRRALERGVSCRSLLDPEEIERSFVRPAYEEDALAGEQIRVASTALPTHALIFDSRVAMLPVDPEDISIGAVIVRTEGIVSALQMLFDRMWHEASPVFVRAGHGPSDLRTDILRLLASGAKDEFIARALNVGLRTVRREIADLLAELGAESRFHAGVLAHSRGWLADAGLDPP